MLEDTNVAVPHQVGIQVENVKRRLGLLSCISFVVGSIIGSGIFISPTGVMQNAGSVGMSLVIWAVCGLITAFCSLVYIELASLIPSSGGEIGYFYKAIGTYPAFMVVWVTCLVISPASNIIICLALAEYVSNMIFDDCGPPLFAKKLLAYFVLLTITLTNATSVRLAARVQILFTFIKVGGLIIIIVGGFVWMVSGHMGSIPSGFIGTTAKPQDIALAIYSGLWAYGGWSSLNLIVEEVVNPRRNIPLAIFISLTLVTSVYLLVNVSYLTVLSKVEFVSSWAVGVSWGEKVLGGGAILIPIIVASSVYGATNGGVFVSGRIMYTASRLNLFPEVFSYINIDTQIPLPSIILTHVFSLILLIPGDIANLINLLSFLGWLFFGLSMVTVIILRFKMKDSKRTIKVPLPLPILMFFVSIFLTIAPFLTNPKIEFLYAVGFLALGTIVYFPFVFFKFKVPYSEKFIRLIQIWMKVVPTSSVKLD